jgi:hypothetical protein
VFPRLLLIDRIGNNVEMRLNDQDIETFRVAYRHSFQKEIDVATAREMATRLMTIVLLVSRVPPSQRAQQPESPTS